MDKRLLLAIALSVLVVVAYQEYLRIYYPQTPPRRPPATEVTPPPQVARETPPGPPVLSPVEPAPPGEAPPAGDVKVSTAVFDAELASRGGRLVSLRLRNYRATVDPQSPGFQLVSPGMSDLPLALRLRGEEAWSDHAVEYRPSTSSLRLAAGEAGEIVFEGETPAGSRIVKRIRFDGGRYDFTVSVRVDPLPAGFSEAALSWIREPVAEQGYYAASHGVEALIGTKLRYFDSEELERGVIVPDPRGVGNEGPVRWAGYADSYFLSAIVPGESDAARLWVKKEPATGIVSTEILVPIGAVSQPYDFTVFTGPKDIGILSEVGHGLARAIDLGWFSFVAEPLLRVLKLFHRATGNYGLDIILLTVLIKILFWPLTHKSFQSMRDLQKLQPQLKKLQEKHKDDREQLNKEVMELYRRHKVNPLGGCLPMLLQMPIFIGLYNALLSAVELRHAPFALWINDLSAPDRLPPFPHEPLAVLYGYDIRIPVLTLLMGASMLVQQKMSPAAADPMQQRMMMLMPVVFTVMFVNFPAGLVLYWLVNNILTIAQQAWMQRSQT